ncbi:MAG TPA: glycosyltransferase, partial [Myxococcota bacterium]|nr:glycosyltransferase [Myxococcota bacterium]
GPRYHDELKKSYGELPEGVVLVGYEDRMGDAYALADLVVCRAGSSTLAELAALGKPSLLIPSPNVTDNHQEHNARGLEQVGAAVVVLEKGIDTAKVAEKLRSLLAEPESLQRMAAAAKGLARLDVAEQVAELLVGRFLPAP